MKFLHFKSYELLSEAVASHIVDAIKNQKTISLGISTGSSPKGIYENLGRYLNERPELSERIRIVQLDEWSGLSPDHKASCQAYIRRHIIEPWNLKDENCFLLDGIADPDLEIRKMKKLLDDNPIDLCILGLGVNGHLALNEPGSDIHSECRKIKLSASSRRHQMITGINEVTHGLTIGLKELLESKKIYFIISGENKTSAYQQFIERVPVPTLPATSLYVHDDCSCFKVDNLKVVNLGKKNYFP